MLTMKAARLSLCCFAFVRRSAISRLPSGKVFTGTTFKPAMTADLGVFQRSKATAWRIFTHRRVSSVCADRNETDIPVALTTRFVISPDDTQTRIFASSSRIWLY